MLRALQKLRREIAEAVALNAALVAQLVGHPAIRTTVEISTNGARGHPVRAVSVAWHVWDGRRWRRRRPPEPEE